MAGNVPSLHTMVATLRDYEADKIIDGDLSEIKQLQRKCGEQTDDEQNVTSRNTR